MSDDHQSLKNMLLFAEGLAKEPSHLSPTKLNREVIKVLRLVTRGWRLIVGLSVEDADALEIEIGEALGELSRNLKAGRGRREGDTTTHNAATDDLVLADMAAGMSLRAAVRNHYSRQIETHERRIKRRREEVRKLIALQTPDGGDI